jgi:putative membrane protein
MVDLLLKLAVTGVALVVATAIVPGLRLSWADPVRALAVVALFALVNSYLRPIVKLLSLPLTLMTFGLVGLLVNLGLFLLVGFLSGELGLGFSVAGWPRERFDIDVLVAAFLGSLIMSIVSTVLAIALKGRRLLGL